MARHEQDREDLMREATALIRRVEVQLPGFPQSCVIGFRRSGEASLFVGADPVFQFNGAGQLRRGYWNGCLIKAEGGRLVHLERRRADAETQLVRREFTDRETAEFLQLATDILDRLQSVLLAGELVVLKRVPADMNVLRDVANWLDTLPRPLTIASLPNVGT